MLLPCPIRYTTCMNKPGRKPGSWTGANNPRWKGGVRLANGYRYIQCPQHPNANSNGYVREHVLVMSEFLLRPIAKNEIVHHINEDTLDNRLENLRVMTRSEHHSLHHRGRMKPNSLKNLKPKTAEYLATVRPFHKQFKTCLHCGSQFHRRGSKPKYCSHSCYVGHCKIRKILP